MFRFLTAASLSATLVLASLAPTPVQAANRDNLAPIIIGAGILAVIAAAARADDRDDRKKKRHKPAPVARNRQAPPAATMVRPYGRNQTGLIEPANPRWVLPAQCSRSFQFEQGNRDFLLRKCLRNNGVRVGQLPDRCQRSFKVAGNKDVWTGWQRACLRREGYVIR